MPRQIVSVSEGLLAGLIDKTSSGFYYNYYDKIPFIKQPVGELRFKDPQEAEKWEGIKSDLLLEYYCQKYQHKKKSVETSEDNIYIKVYTPSRATSKSKLPVIYFIHNSIFYFKGNYFDYYRLDLLLEKNIVIVASNYRAGPLGFLCLHTDEVPGNAGLKDQLFALRWIQRNISVFGGDPENVTLMGSGINAECVQYHTMSPLSAGLFVKAIMHSGNVVSPWATQENPVQNAFDLAKKLGYVTTNKKHVLKFLRFVNFKLFEEVIKIPFNNDMNSKFCAVVEKEYSNHSAFLTESTLNIIRSDNYKCVPNIQSFSPYEDFRFLTPEVRAINNSNCIINDKKLGIIIQKQTKQKLSESQLEEIRMNYFRHDIEPICSVNNILTDLFLVLTGIKSINMTRRNQEQTYACYINYGYRSYYNTCSGFGIEDKAKRLMNDLYATFIIEGQPKITFNHEAVCQPTEKDKNTYFHVCSYPKMIHCPFEARKKFWEKILPDFHKY